MEGAGDGHHADKHFAVDQITRHALLSDRMCLHYFELPKLPEVVSADDELKLWLTLFKTETEEELAKIEALGVPVMNQAIEAYRHVTVTDEFRELERQRHYAAHNRASALGHARREGYREADEKWMHVVADKDALIAKLLARLGEDK